MVNHVFRDMFTLEAFTTPINKQMSSKYTGSLNLFCFYACQWLFVLSTEFAKAVNLIEFWVIRRRTFELRS